MHWNNRIFKHVKDNIESYAIHECFYDDSGRTLGWTETPETGHYDSVEDLIEGLKQILRDVEKSKDDVLDYNSKPESNEWEADDEKLNDLELDGD